MIVHFLLSPCVHTFGLCCVKFPSHCSSEIVVSPGVNRCNIREEETTTEFMPYIKCQHLRDKIACKATPLDLQLE